MSHRSVLTLGERLEVEAALEAAFEPLREARTDLSPLRVRAAVRWGRGAPAATVAAVKWSGAIARLSELSVAVGMSVLIFTAALGPALPHRSAVDPSLAAVATDMMEQEREIRAFRLEWLELLRSRLDAVRIHRPVPVQDWLDPAVPWVAPPPPRPALPAPHPY